MSLRKLECLLKEASDKHRGVFYYINRKRKMGKQSAHVMTAKEYGKFLALLRRAHAIASSRSSKKKK
jgi:hypothetical protein